MKANLPSVHTVADFFLLQVEGSEGDVISNLKLQKLCYYAQAWHLAITGKPLFSQQIKAWAHGPVIPDLYHRFKAFGSNSIDPSQLVSHPYEDLHAEDCEFLADIWAKYGAFSASQLERLTHSESPWKDAYGDTVPGLACEAIISHEAMQHYYKGLQQVT
jgi:uncharacterized phage-associated protein